MRIYIIIFIAATIFTMHNARAGETCTQIGNRLECYTDDGEYREEFQYGNRTDKYADDGTFTQCQQIGNREECY